MHPKGSSWRGSLTHSFVSDLALLDEMRSLGACWKMWITSHRILEWFGLGFGTLKPISFLPQPWAGTFPTLPPALGNRDLLSWACPWGSSGETWQWLCWSSASGHFAPKSWYQTGAVSVKSGFPEHRTKFVMLEVTRTNLAFLLTCQCCSNREFPEQLKSHLSMTFPISWFSFSPPFSLSFSTRLS